MTMETAFDLAIISDVLRMGWLFPHSAISEIICPDLAAKARVDEWSPQRFIQEALPKIPMWVGSKLAIRTYLLEAPSQNFVLRMIARRPDLFYDRGKGPLQTYLAGILWTVYHETLREERCGHHEDRLAEREDFKQRPVRALLEDREEFQNTLRLI